MTCRYDREFADYLTPDGTPCLVDEYGDKTRHCTARRNCSVHVGAGEITCPRCIGRVRSLLRKIPDLAALMLPVALTAGVNSEAANLAGPAADVEAWSWRKVAARQGKAWHLSLIEEDDELHPYTVLARWEAMIREDYDQPRDTPTTISEAADYLGRNLGRIAQDPEQDFPLLAHELRKCHQHLESVLATAKRPERGAPCPECTSEETGVGPRLVREFGHWCEDEACEKVHFADDSADVWVCPRDRDHTWEHEAYTRWIETRQGKRKASA